MRNLQTPLRFVAILGVAVLVGCGAKYEGDKRYEISGAVTFNGQPIVEGSIDMAPLESDGNPVSGMIENGEYHFTEEVGPTLGKYRVEIYGFQAEGGPAGGDDEDAEAAEANMKQVVPPQFNKETTLEIEVIDGENKHDFNLMP